MHHDKADPRTESGKELLELLELLELRGFNFWRMYGILDDL